MTSDDAVAAALFAAAGLTAAAVFALARRKT